MGCQGAAVEGIGYRHILAAYYPGTELVADDPTRRIKVLITADRDGDLRVAPRPGLVARRGKAMVRLPERLDDRRVTVWRRAPPARSPAADREGGAVANGPGRRCRRRGRAGPAGVGVEPRRPPGPAPATAGLPRRAARLPQPGDREAGGGEPGPPGVLPALGRAQRVVLDVGGPRRLRAQSVAARTYARWRARQRSPRRRRRRHLRHHRLPGLPRDAALDAGRPGHPGLGGRRAPTRPSRPRRGSTCGTPARPRSPSSPRPTVAGPPPATSRIWWPGRTPGTASWTAQPTPGSSRCRSSG